MNVLKTNAYRIHVRWHKAGPLWVKHKKASILKSIKAASNSDNDAEPPELSSQDIPKIPWTEDLLLKIQNTLQLAHALPNKKKNKMVQDPYSFRLSSKQSSNDSLEALITNSTGEKKRNAENMLNFRMNLPAWKSKSEILHAIQNNQVTIIVGQTGCGKTTQIPQYILDGLKHEGIICTQPRRISAISVAKRVADERFTSVGDKIGWQVRFLKECSPGKTQLLFCTFGILLRRLVMDKTLAGISHIIIDEVHERSLDSDFLLILLRELLNGPRKDLKVILMSATMEYSKLSAYFGDAPVIQIEGRTFPVQSYFLEDLLEKKVVKPQAYDFLTDNDDRKKTFMENSQALIETLNSKQDNVSSYSLETATLLQQLSVNLQEASECAAAITDVVKHILSNYSSVNGWNVILKVQSALKKLNEKIIILPLHSQTSNEDQQKVFLEPPNGFRKVIVATNIAETSITIPDVSFVIDAGHAKLLSYDPILDIASLYPALISESSMNQRKGRAGRVRSGTCFHMYPSTVLQNMEKYNEPELKRTPLEEVVLLIHTLGLAEKFIDKESPSQYLLSKALEPPDSLAIDRALCLLRQLGAMSFDSEKLTPLGEKLADLPVHPILGKLILFGSVFGVPDDAVTIAGILSAGSIVNLPVTSSEKQAQKDYLRHVAGDFKDSDHLALLRIFKYWFKQHRRFTEDDKMRMFLSFKELNSVVNFRKQIKDHLGLSRLEAETRSDDALLLGIICGCLWPRVQVIKARPLRNRSSLRGSFGKKVGLQLSSLNHFGNNKQKTTIFEQKYLAYFMMLKSSSLQVYDVTPIPPVALLLFSSFFEQIETIGKDKVVVLLHQQDNITYSMTKVDFELFLAIRQGLNLWLDFYVNHPMEAERSPLKRKFIDIIKSMLQISMENHRYSLAVETKMGNLKAKETSIDTIEEECMEDESDTLE